MNSLNVEMPTQPSYPATETSNLVTVTSRNISTDTLQPTIEVAAISLPASEIDRVSSALACRVSAV